MKAYARFILKKRKTSPKFLSRFLPDREDELKYIEILDKRVTKAKTIAIDEIKDFLTQDELYCSVTRTLAYNFLRKRFVSHIFNSKMEKRWIHLKYVSRWR